MENYRKDQENIILNTPTSSEVKKEYHLLLKYKNSSQYLSEEKCKNALEWFEFYRALPKRGKNIDINECCIAPNETQKGTLFSMISKKELLLSISDKIKNDISGWNSPCSLKDSYFNKLKFSKIKKLLKMDLSNDLENKIYQFIIWSKDSVEITTASSNAIGILKKCGFSFTNKYFSNIKIPEADLSNCAFINTNFENSDLSQANFSQSNFYSSSLLNTNLNQADFGWKAQIDTRCIVKAVAYSKCGKFLASNTNMKNITIWRNGDICEKVAELIEHTLEVTSLSFSPCSKYLISGSKDRTIKMWDLKTFKLIQDYKWHKRNVISVKFSPNGKFIVSSGKDLLIIIWNVDKNQIESSIELENAKIKSFAWHPYRYLLGFTNISPKITIWDISAKKSIWEINSQKKIYKNTNKKESRSIAFSPCGKFLAWSGKKNRIQLWKIESKERYRVFQSYSGCLCFSNDGEKIISWNSDFSIKLWNINENDNYGCINRHNGMVKSISQSPCGKYLASGGSDWKLVISNFKKQKMVNSHAPSPVFVSLSKCGKFMASINNFHLIIWDFMTYQIIKKICIWKSDITSISFSYDSSIIAYSGWKTPIILVYLNQNFSQKALEDSKNSIVISFAPNSNRLLSSQRNSIFLWDADNRIKLEYIGNHREQVTCIVWSPKSNEFASSSSDLNIKIWKESHTKSLIGLTDIDNTLAYFPSGKYLASGGLDWVLKIWDTKEGNLLYSLYFFYNPISNISLSGSYIAIGFSQKFIYIWNVKIEKIMTILHGHKTGIKSVCFSNCGNYLVSSGDDGTIKVWNLSKLIEKNDEEKVIIQKKAVFVNREEIRGLDEGWKYLEWSSVIPEFINARLLHSSNNLNIPA